jgi:divalent metal cation (Fe/Co/Zn/Cd) transporter
MSFYLFIYLFLPGILISSKQVFSNTMLLYIIALWSIVICYWWYTYFIYLKKTN